MNEGNSVNVAPLKTAEGRVIGARLEVNGTIALLSVPEFLRFMLGAADVLHQHEREKLSPLLGFPVAPPVSRSPQYCICPDEEMTTNQRAGQLCGRCGKRM